MLEMLPRANVSQDVHRLADLSYIAAFSEKKGVTIEEVTEVIRFSRNDGTREWIQGAVPVKPHLGAKFRDATRFADGEWPVLYAAVDRTTAGKEAAHHYGRRAAGDPASPRAVYYSIVRCGFFGEIIDLRP